MKKMSPIFLACLLLLLTHCGRGAQGGSEFGNPSRSVMGTLKNIEDATLVSPLSKLGSLIIRSAHAAPDCPADTLIATDSQAQTKTTSMKDDCSFDLELTTGKAYALHFVSGSTFVANLIVHNSPLTLRSTVFFVSRGESDINLGSVTIVDNEAVPETEPATQNDQDGDGFDDYEDPDDDGDLILDEAEEDCDLDDYEDDYDESDPCDTSEVGEPTTAEVLEVIPSDGEEFVPPDGEVVARFDCEIDEGTISTDTFQVESEGGDIGCEFSFSDSSSVVECDHDDQNFLPSLTYTATLEGILCADGTEVTSVSWSWTTE